MMGFSCFSQTQTDSLAGFDKKHELDHIMDHRIDSSQIEFYLNLSRKRYINRKYNLGIYAPPKKLSSSSSFDCSVDNWGFEDGTFSGWNQLGAVDIISNGVDPYGGFAWVYPNGGNFSAKISSDLNCCRDGRLDKVLNVSASGETLMSFHFAMSIFNYPHVSTQAAKLWVEFYDGGGNLLPCPQYECYYSTDNGAVGVNNFQQTPQPASFYNPLANGDGPSLYPVTYADWNTVTLDLSAYQGQQITAVFRVEWCVPDVDWAYVLLDVDCPLNTFEPTNICLDENGQGTLCGPDNMSSYTWYDPSGAIVGNNQCLDINAAGTYVLEAMPANVECTSASLLTFNYSIDPPLDILYVASNYNGNNISCNGYNDGNIDIDVNGGSFPYIYNWSTINPASSDQFNLYAGSYDLQLTDARGCVLDTTFLLTEPTLLQTTIAANTDYNGYDISCYGYSDGGIDLTVSGSVPGYSYLWSNGSATEDLTSLSAGTYIVDITDLNSCTTSTSIALTDPSVLQTTIAANTVYNGYDISCYGYSDGEIDLGDPRILPYTYLWNNNATTEDVTNLSLGTYSVDITDLNLCTSSTSITLIEPTLLLLTSNVAHDTCNREGGMVEVIVAGGVFPYNYMWSNNQITDAINLSSDVYTATITDANNCIISEEFYQYKLGFIVGIASVSDLPIHRLYRQMDNPIIFIDKSVDNFTIIKKWFWEFGDGFSSTYQNPRHSFSKIGDYNVTLAIENLYGCVGTTTDRVIINEFLLYIPNSFTPQGDKINDSFLPKGIGIKEYELKIYNRWGKHFFTSNNLNIGWNGTANKKDKIAQIGVYVYLINVTDVFGEKHTYRGQVTLIK